MVSQSPTAMPATKTGAANLSIVLRYWREETVRDLPKSFVNSGMLEELLRALVDPAGQQVMDAAALLLQTSVQVGLDIDDSNLAPDSSWIDFIIWPKDGPVPVQIDDMINKIYVMNPENKPDYAGMVSICKLGVDPGLPVRWKADSQATLDNGEPFIACQPTLRIHLGTLSLDSAILKTMGYGRGADQDLDALFQALFSLESSPIKPRRLIPSFETRLLTEGLWFEVTQLAQNSSRHEVQLHDCDQQPLWVAEEEIGQSILTVDELGPKLASFRRQ